MGPIPALSTFDPGTFSSEQDDVSRMLAKVDSSQ
jgi:hypothetical protein